MASYIDEHGRLVFESDSPASTTLTINCSGTAPEESLVGITGLGGEINCSGYAPAESISMGSITAALIQCSGYAPAENISSSPKQASLIRTAGVAPAETLSVTISTALGINCAGTAPAEYVRSGGIAAGNVIYCAGTAPQEVIDAFEFQTLTETFEGLLVNTNTLGPAKYDGYDFNSIWQGSDGFLYGANSSGISRLTGSTDNSTAIDATITTGISDMKARNKKRFTYAWLTLRDNAQMSLSVSLDEKAFKTYTVDARDGQTGIHRKRVRLDKGPTGSHAQFEFANVDGSNFDFRLCNVDFEDIGRS